MKTLFVVIVIYINLFTQNGWYPTPTPLAAELYSIRFVDTLYGWTAGSYGNVYASTDGGESWFQQERKTTQKFRSIFFVDRNTGWVVGDSGKIYKTTNGGNNWFAQASETELNITTSFFTDEDYGWAAGNIGMILKTTNGGLNWTKLKFTQIGNIKSIFFNNRNTGWVVDAEAIWKTTNSGLSWESKFVLAGASQILFTDSLTGWARGAYGFDPPVRTLYKTIDGGETWNFKFAQLGTHWYSMSGVDTTHLWIISSETHIIKTSDGGTNWLEHVLGQGFVLYSIFFIDKNNGWASGTGNGNIFKTKDGGALTSVKEGGEFPTEYALFQNYPNPFNPVTTITYQIPKEGLVTLKIYDILGKEVTTLLNEEKQAGKYSIEFNASKLSSGVYLYELRSNEYKSTKKLLLMK